MPARQGVVYVQPGSPTSAKPRGLERPSDPAGTEDGTSADPQAWGMRPSWDSAGEGIPYPSLSSSPRSPHPMTSNDIARARHPAVYQTELLLQELLLGQLIPE